MSSPRAGLTDGRLLAWALEWMKARCHVHDELAGLSREELRVLSADLAIDQSDLVALSASRHDNTDLMERMIRARGFDPNDLRQSFAVLLRDVERVCSTCRSTGRCRRELDAGTAAAHAHQYCPNTATFDDLLEYLTSA